jgi:hypothetical protein
MPKRSNSPPAEPNKISPFILAAVTDEPIAAPVTDDRSQETS